MSRWDARPSETPGPTRPPHSGSPAASCGRTPQHPPFLKPHRLSECGGRDTAFLPSGRDPMFQHNAASHPRPAPSRRRSGIRPFEKGETPRAGPPTAGEVTARGRARAPPREGCASSWICPNGAGGAPRCHGASREASREAARRSCRPVGADTLWGPRCPRVSLRFTLGFLLARRWRANCRHPECQTPVHPNGTGDHSRRVAVPAAARGHGSDGHPRTPLS